VVTVRNGEQVVSEMTAAVMPASPVVFAAVPTDPGILTVYATGLGRPHVAVQTGALNPDGANALETTVSATISGVAARVLWAGMTPRYVGLQQVAVEIPEGFRWDNGPAELRLLVNGEASPPYALSR
jgi:uncharacterized protein (TIGR03437 family)